MNDKLFQRVKTVHENAASLGLNPEQMMLLNETYKSFVRGGANLSPEDKDKLKVINKELGLLSLNFGSNVLKESNSFELLVENEADLAGLPANVIAAAAESAKEKHGEGKWVFTVQKSSMIPLLTYAKNRELRKQILMGYTTRANHDDSLDNKANVAKMVNLRLQKAQLLGYANFAAYILEDNMAKTPEKAYELLSNVLGRATERAKLELVDLQKLANADKITIEAWDWWYYAEKMRQAKYNLSEEEMLPYFQLENVRDGMFDVANKLFNLTFKENKELPVMDSLATAYEVYKGDKMIAVLYMDYFPRASKRAGAWMTAYRKQSRDIQGNNIMPIISLTCNFTPGSGNAPSLLNLDEVTTLFHEFGHGLHGLLSDCQYESLSGTSVSRDFVELPSQIMENWALEPEVMKSYAKHYQTGEVIPDALIEKMKKASTFNNGFVATEFVAAAALDMAWHSISEPFTGDVNAFEKEAMDEIGLIKEIIVRYRSTYYSHIFSGGYAAGYYAYLWTAVLDADAFGAFQETSLFDKTTAESFEKNILSRGGTVDSEQMWLNFRGREPKIDFYLKRQGL
jgi:peptidyl-dipeptidase Dcp